MMYLRTMALALVGVAMSTAPAAAAAGGSAAAPAIPATVKICHASETSPATYAAVTMKTAALDDHSGHGDDIIPAPVQGCPASPSAGGATPSSVAPAMPGTASGGSSSNERITICHATSSITNPYVQITVSKAALAGHRKHNEDIIPAPVTGCPAVKDNPGENPLPPQPRCSSTTPVLAYASGRRAMTLRACDGTTLRIFADPWITFREPGASAPQVFPIGYGKGRIDLPGAVVVEWDTDPIARNALSWMRFSNGKASVTINTVDRMLSSSPAPAAGVVRILDGPTRSADGVMASIVPLTTADLARLRDAMLMCVGSTQMPLACKAPGIPTLPVMPTPRPPLPFIPTPQQPLPLIPTPQPPNMGDGRNSATINV